ncbi:MAG: helix-turn-helix domain-containing protein [Actinomycetes bacterium]|jgi:transcriptional regulator with XRE-family HTH domain
MARPLPHRTVRAAADLGDHLRTWRKLQRLTIEQVAERAGSTRNTVSRLEHGDPSVGLDVVLNVCRALGVLDQLVRSLDPYETELGRARADEILPQRVRR